MSLKFTQEETTELTQSAFKGIFAQLLGEGFFGSMFELMRTSMPEKLMAKLDKVEQAYPQFMDFMWTDKLDDEMVHILLKTRSGMRRVLCHGDLWSTNILFKQKGEDLSVAAVIDFQTAHMGCSAIDLVRLFASCLSGKDRRQHWEVLVDEFYGYLKEEVGDKEMPYSLEQLKESYRRFMPMGGFLLVIIIGPILDLLCKTTDLELKQKALNTKTPFR
ncbi:hypothetical protein OESDEN_14182 [Oesophagostomum dentatum]|uniref:CHK kinase-like domain-containing protein n=1 Tax=Oesophagostomum dentatum TaxID=61180 RepID=A0A0B1SMC3_OESDE|nr:hypothetical protein OESDEN_14182 [Oesophagostomum dentatum]